MARAKMAKPIFFLIALVILSLGFGGNEKEVVFKDKHLERMMREELKAPLTPENLAGVTRIAGSRVRYLDGLEYCPNLREIDLSNGTISDLEPLSGLTALESLDLNLNVIHDLSPLIHLSRLRRLDVCGNRIFDLKPLAQMPWLEKLNLESNPFVDISPLARLKNLTYLRLGEERTYGYADGVIFPVTTYLLGVQVAIWDEVLNRTNATNVLYSFAGRVTRTQGLISLKPLSGCVKLKSLSLDGNRIHSLKPLAAMKEMLYLSAPENFITDLSPILGMENLSEISLEQNLITDLEPLLVLGRKGKLNNARIHLAGNPLSLKARREQLPELRRLAKEVTFTSQDVTKFIKQPVSK